MFTLKNNEIVFDPESNDQLVDAVIVSLFSRKKVSQEELKEYYPDSGGYWGDLIDNTSLGSKLWLQEREVQSPETIENFREYVAEALEWMKEQSLVRDIEVSCSYLDEKILIAIFLDDHEFKLRV